tara:strand:- start:979 stop:1656 length:678 start_codon:yes stop_codon:yes gene_type:complete
MNESTKDTNVDNVSKFFDGYAHDFSSIYLEDTKKRSSFNKIMDNIFRKDIQDRHDKTIGFTGSNKNINTVLDIGCGPGHQVVEFLKQGKQVTALDVAPSMLDITKNRVAAMGAEPNFDSVLADYSSHYFDKKFDAACVLGFFDYVEDPVSVLKKLLSEVNYEIYISIPGNKGLLALQRKIRYSLRNCPLYLYSLDSLTQHLKDAGCFEQSEIIDTERGYYVVIRK